MNPSSSHLGDERRHFRASDDALLEMSFDLVDEPDARYTSEKRDFLDSVKTRTPSWEPAEVGHCVTSTCLLGHLAINLGERTDWLEAVAGAE